MKKIIFIAIAVIIISLCSFTMKFQPLYIAIAIFALLQLSIGFCIGKTNRDQMQISLWLILTLGWSILQIVGWGGNPWCSTVNFIDYPVGITLSFATPVVLLLLIYTGSKILGMMGILVLGYFQFRYLDGSGAYLWYTIAQTSATFVGLVLATAPEKIDVKSIFFEVVFAIKQRSPRKKIVKA